MDHIRLVSEGAACSDRRDKCPATAVAGFLAGILCRKGVSAYALYYYKRDDSHLEEDFFVRTQRELLPLEVKANQNRSKSLSALIKNERYADVSHGLKLTKGNIGESGGIYTFPYFCAFLIKRCLETWPLS